MVTREHLLHALLLINGRLSSAITGIISWPDDGLFFIMNYTKSINNCQLDDKVIQSEIN